MDKLNIMQRSRVMSKIKSKDTKPELAVRKFLFSKGFRYRIHPDLPGRPDIVFAKYRTVVFVNGCFWHGHNCKKARLPQTNIDFWKDKINKNKLRDRRNIEILEVKGWRIVTLWECLLKVDFEGEMEKLIEILS